ncbi:uncharacterized protein [Physeter macrocephalus]|uniref:Uncharacterized protein isoform X2 n=1 Tax=Physeter macrocephalus TaxID=9755 RepID=A0A455BHA0_PHYMC|nr:uncharacterized protein LOC114486646 isoform X2 [Physeter catodon]|eukprot:XP_028348335.1 uncharacterized protein LOC114486646 isoform X3 [Physeter catodon]
MPRPPPRPSCKLDRGAVVPKGWPPAGITSGAFQTSCSPGWAPEQLQQGSWAPACLQPDPRSTRRAASCFRQEQDFLASWPETAFSPSTGKSGLQGWTGGALAPCVACQNEPTLAAEALRSTAATAAGRGLIVLPGAISPGTRSYGFPFFLTCLDYRFSERFEKAVSKTLWG